jgi:hypothetical protein
MTVTTGTVIGRVLAVDVAPCPQLAEGVESE